jgi:hypothetical protein
VKAKGRAKGPKRGEGAPKERKAVRSVSDGHGERSEGVNLSRSEVLSLKGIGCYGRALLRIDCLRFFKVVTMTLSDAPFGVLPFADVYSPAL